MKGNEYFIEFSAKYKSIRLIRYFFESTLCDLKKIILVKFVWRKE